MKRLFPLLVVILMLPLVVLHRPSCAATIFDYSDYRLLLDRYLLPDRQINDIAVNVLDYARMQQEQDRVGTPYMRLLKSLGEFDPAGIEDGPAQMAFWINVYNIAAIKTILDHYPVDSIRSRKINWLKRPWKRKAIKVNGRVYSLADIEKKLMRNFRDPRVYLALNNAAVSSPDLRYSPYRGTLLEDQLRDQGERLAAQPGKGLRIDRAGAEVRISKIFRFHRGHFTSLAGGAVSFLLPYVDPADQEYLAAGDFELDYLDYNWTLNDLKQVEND